MQISSRFTIAVHVITAIDYFKDKKTVTSNFLAGSVGVNAVIIRSVMSQLKDAGIVDISQGKSGIRLAKKLSDITFYDTYKALDLLDESGLFHFHEHPNNNCPVGDNIQEAMEGRLQSIQDAMEAQMKKITLADVEAEVRRKAGRKSYDIPA